jgi:hypothetical protein
MLSEVESLNFLCLALKRNVPSPSEIPQRFSDVEEFLYDNNTTEMYLLIFEPQLIDNSFAS